ncbi:MAG: hypothetical protein EU542_07015 [Promethearchaeota archaeon]|nr:MAG: hypothetical protein EU542_07015 [Candidatus Lokiarchaeota archaeon]
MPYCEFCGEEIGFLPFKCKYCGGIFCKEHRLPENHECTFERKHRPTVPTSKRSEKREKERDHFVSTDEDPRKIRKFLRKQEKQRDRAKKLFESGISGYGGVSISRYLIPAILITSIVAFIIPEFVCLSSSSFFNFYIWTFFTAPFATFSYYLLDFFFLFFTILLFSPIIRIIELRFGNKFLIKLYLFSTFLTALIYLLFWLPIQIPNLPNLIFLPIGLAFGGLLGISSFIIYFSLEREMTFLFMFFIPIRMKGKSILLILVLLRLVPGLLSFLFYFNPIILLYYIPDLGGILASYLIFRYKFRYIR